MLERAGANARFATEEFFKTMLNNEHTRRAYTPIVKAFLVWCDEHGKALQLVTPSDAGEYFAQLQGSIMTKNQALAALRHYFDVLVTRHAVPLNAFASVRGIKHRIGEGKTAEIETLQPRKPIACAIGQFWPFLLTPARASARPRSFAWAICAGMASNGASGSAK